MASDGGGPDADRAGYDPIAQAASGRLARNGEPQGQAVKAPTLLADARAGLHAAFATRAALRHRDRTSEGQHVDVSLPDAMPFHGNGHLTLGALLAAWIESRRAREMRVPVAQEDGTEIPIPGPAAPLSRMPARVRGVAPGLGRDTDEVLREAGVLADAIAALRAPGVV